VPELGRPFSECASARNKPKGTDLTIGRALTMLIVVVYVFNAIW
jgi:hypothetical protein